jgi:nucleoside-diphosphate-sugar epimerase
MKVLFIGGTGNISIAVTQLLLEKNIDLFLLNRGISGIAPPRATSLHLDIEDLGAVSRLLQNHQWDVVVNWIAYTPAQIQRDLTLFQGKTRQYVFISSASAYQKPPSHYLVTESTPLGNPFWEYARNKIACETLLVKAFHDSGFPFTIVRPSLTYGNSWIPCAVGGHDFTVVNRMRQGKKIIVHGDGQSLWTMTHNSDFAVGIAGLLGMETAIGECFHITSDEVLTWDQIYSCIANAAGVAPHLIHIPSDFIASFDQRTADSLRGDKMYSQVFDNSKIKHWVPEYQAKISFAEGIKQSLAWFDEDSRRKTVDLNKDALMDRIISAFANGERRPPGE